jgi:hypothetical protein
LFKRWPERVVLVALICVSALYALERWRFEESMLCSKWLWDVPYHYGRARVISKQLLPCESCSYYDHEKEVKAASGQYGLLVVKVLDLGGGGECSERYLGRALEDLGRGTVTMNVAPSFAENLNPGDIIEFEFSPMSGDRITVRVRGYSGNVTVKR